MVSLQDVQADDLISSKSTMIGSNLLSSSSSSSSSSEKNHTEPTNVDSDSGRGRTSSSSTASNSSDCDNQLDCFVDAQDELNELEQVAGDHDHNNGNNHGSLEPKSSGGPESASGPGWDQDRASLKVRLDETTEILRLALSNEFNRAIGICGQRAHKELYASLAHATLSFLRAALTLEQADLQSALASINQSFEVSSRRRRRRGSSAASMMMRLLYRPNYNQDYTDDEIHAELVHAESLLLLALISFLADQSIICLVRGAFRIRTCYQRYKECQHIMETRNRWQYEESRRHFESGVRMGHGIFNLLMSYLPRRVLRFLEYVGFSGNRSVGIEELDRSVELGDGLRSVFSALVILTYHSYVENLFGLGHYDERRVEQLNQTFLGHYPNSAFFLLFLGRYHQMRGQLDEAIESFEACIRAQDDWKQFHSICHWEIMWCHAVQMDWCQAAKYSDLLRRQSKWSPASYTYQYGTFLYAKLVEEQRNKLIDCQSGEYRRRMDEIRSIMESVPQLRIRYCGKTIPAEKFAITRAERFCKQSLRLTLPALEFLYIWNVFCTLRNSPKQVESLLQRIDSEINYIQEQQQQQQQTMTTKMTTGDSTSDDANNDGGQEDWTDDLCLVLLLRGMCLKHLGRFDEADSSFMSVIKHSDEIHSDTFLLPHTEMELAILNLHLKRYEIAKNWIKSARQNYTGYLLETIVHFRLHAASRLIRLEQLDLELSSSCESPTIEKKGKSRP